MSEWAAIVLPMAIALVALIHSAVTLVRLDGWRRKANEAEEDRARMATLIERDYPRIGRHIDAIHTRITKLDRMVPKKAQKKRRRR